MLVIRGDYMKFKYLFLSLFAIGICFLFPLKVEAIDISYCIYNNTKLPLPVTIGVEVDGFNANFPFDTTKNYSYSDSLYVYDASSCRQNLKLPNFIGNNGMDIIKVQYDTYYVTTQYYYIYNNTYTYSSFPLLNGNYSVTDTTPPTITTSSREYIVSVNSKKELDFFSSTIMAYDTNDGTIIPEIIEDYYSEKYNIPGEYSLVYKACDKRQNCTKLSLIIHVIDDVSPTISGNHQITSYMSNPISLFQIANSLIASDNCDGDISTSIYTVGSYYNTNYPGTYYALFDVKDKSGNFLDTPFKVEINHIDDIPPSIEGATKFNSYLSAPLSLNYILSNLIPHDNITNISTKDLYVISDNYSPNKEKVGTYKIAISCLDEYGNEAKPYLVEIDVFDNVKPTIDGKREFTSYASNPITISQIKSKLIALDKHDGNLTHKLEILSDSYSLNEHKTGVYYISFIVSDSSNNSSDVFEIEIICLDDVLPTITGESYYLTLTTQKISIDSLILSLDAMDNIDGNISHLIELNEDTYSSNYNIPGEYYLTYYVCDKSGNISIPFKIKIVVNDNLDFLSSLNNSHLFLNTNILLNENEILNLLNIDYQNYDNITLVEDSYSTHYNIAGEYKMIFQFTNTDYSKEYLEIKITTFLDKSTNTKMESPKSKKKATIFSFIVAFFKNSLIGLFGRIKNIFIH